MSSGALGGDTIVALHLRAHETSATSTTHVTLVGRVAHLLHAFDAHARIAVKLVCQVRVAARPAHVATHERVTDVATIISTSSAPFPTV